jgi:protein TonB
MTPARPTHLQDWSSFSIALTLHGLVLLGLIIQASAPGAGTRETTAISLNLIETQIVEASEQSAPNTSDGSDVEIDKTTGARREAAPSASRREQQKDEAKSEANPTGDKALATPQKQRTKQRSSSQPSNAQRKGGAQSRAKSAKKSSPGTVSASRGTANNYAGRVRARLASRRPRNMLGQGTAVVRFGLSRSGSVRYVKLARSSGNRSLDSAALAAVRRAAPYPRPPAGMSLRQLSFSIPFYFK